MAKQLGQRVVEEAAAIIRSLITEFDRQKSCYCYAHNKHCLVYPNTPPGSLRLNISGLSCLDWSSRGRQMGICGPTALPFFTLMYEFCAGLYDVGIFECTPKFGEEFLSILLASHGEFAGFDVQAANVCNAIGQSSDAGPGPRDLRSQVSWPIRCVMGDSD